MTDFQAPHAHKLRKHDLPPIDVLRQRFRYDPDTGEITRRDGGRCGHKDGQGYLLVLVARYTKVSVLQHRLAFALVEGRWPRLIDHINGDKADNRWSNLREVSASVNIARAYKARPVWNRRNKVWRVGGNKFETALYERAVEYCQAYEATKHAGLPAPKWPTDRQLGLRRPPVGGPNSAGKAKKSVTERQVESLAGPAAQNVQTARRGAKNSL